MQLLAGIFVGGLGSRMGGVAKGLLEAPDGGSIVERTRKLVEGVGAECVLVGTHGAYRDLGIPLLADDPSASGPLGGMLALLSRAGRRTALAIACDMPFLELDVLLRLIHESPDAVVLAPRRHAAEKDLDLWEPLFARYRSPLVLPVARELAARGERRLQALLDAVGARPLALAPGDDRRLEDWDTLPAMRSRATNEP